MMDSFEHALAAGTLIDDRYRIDSVLGEGGFAITYKAFDTKLQCDVAIKEFLPVELAARSTDTKTVQARSNRNDDYSFGLNKFLDEARTLARLQHPNIVQVTNFIEANGTAYLVMSYAEGRELGEWLKTQPGQLSEEAILGIVTPILDGLTRVHEQGLLHRDIKPGNIFLRNVDGPMLIDFGAARHALGEHSKSISAIISQGYAPPEQYVTRGKQSPATDLYAIGATLYHLITGDAPTESVERSHEVHEGEPDPMMPASEAGKGKVSDWLLSLTDQLLAISPKQRPQSAASVLTAISNKTVADINAGAASPAQPAVAAGNKTRVVGDSERFSKPVSSQTSENKASGKGAIVAGIAAVVIALAGGGYYVSQQSSSGAQSTGGKSASTEEAQKPLPTGKAILLVESNPAGAEVFLGDHLLGKTPYQADNLPAGQFELKLVHEMSNDYSEQVTLADNLVVNKTLALTKASGNYSVFSNPAGAQIYIDGKDTGKITPNSLTGLAVGQHELKLTKDAYYPSEHNIYVRKGETLRGDFTLEGGHLVQHEGRWVEPEEKGRRIADAARIAEEKRTAEAARLAEEKRKAEEARQLAEQKRKDEIKEELARKEREKRAAEKRAAEGVMDVPVWEVGDTWTMKNGGQLSGTTKMTVVGQTEYQGQAAYKVKSVSDYNTNQPIDMVMYYSKERLEVLGVVSDSSEMIYRHEILSGRQWPMKVGNQWKTRTAYKILDSETVNTTSYEVVAKEVINLRTGKYECLKVVSNLRDVETGFDQSSTVWWCPKIKYVGKTKTETDFHENNEYLEDSVMTTELISYQ